MSDVLFGLGLFITIVAGTLAIVIAMWKVVIPFCEMFAEWLER